MREFKEKTILITGGTGSFGNAVLDGLLKTGFSEVRIFSRDELKQEQMRKRISNPNVKFYIGDTRDRSSVANAMKNVDIVFHAAALKQVPSCEFFPIQAVLTNIIGSNNVIQAGISNNVSRIICLSTDKAVYPINAMGMSKGLMEKCVQASARNLSDKETIVSCVRYGNVMCSRGSVIPLFINQIKEKRPITVTDPGMTRFLLSLEEAVKLVYFAFEHSGQGDIFVRKSPACTIADLVTALKNIFNSNSPVNIVGIRHGEKIYETLVTREEMSKAEDRGEFFRIKMDDRDLNYDKYFTDGDIEEREYKEFTSHNTRRLSVEDVEILLRGLPEVQAELG